MDLGAPERPLRVGLVGLGVIGRVHLRVLSAIDGIEPVFVVDPRSGGGEPTPPRYPRLAEALAAEGGDLDLVVVATPTDTHLDLAAEALTSTRGTVLSEKPLTRDAGALARFEEDHAEDLPRLRVVNHFAFSPEVEWAARVVARGGWGPPHRVLSVFNDPYVGRTPAERTSYVTSWVDSGPNQLGMLSRFTSGWRLHRHDDQDGLRSVTELAHDGGTATLVSNWWTGDSSKQTVLRWRTGAEVVLDHTAMTAVSLVDGRVQEHLGHDGTVDRKTAHYAAMYGALLHGADEAGLLGLPLARTIAELLSRASSSPASAESAGAGPRWTTGSGLEETATGSGRIG